VRGCRPGRDHGGFDAPDAAVDGVLGLDFEALTTRERSALLERCERVRRRLPAMEHPLINQLAHHATPEELGGKLSRALAEWTLISRAEADRRIREAATLDGFAPYRRALPLRREQRQVVGAPKGVIEWVTVDDEASWVDPITGNRMTAV
jgi:hypothetical protein